MLKKERFCTILVGYSILFKEVIKKNRIHLSKPEVEEENKMNACQLIGNLLVDHAIFQLVIVDVSNSNV